MTNPHALTRRSALATAVGLGVSVSFLGRAAYAAADGELARRKLIVIVCRGGLDGLSVSPPVGDPDYAALRGQIAIAPFGAPGGALKLDDTFGLHPALKSVHRLALAGQARIAPAVATPDRARSHFEAQDVLESGGTVAYGAGSGWLNRTLQALAPARRIEALSVGTQAPLILRGKIQAASWSPGGLEGRDERLPRILADLYARDPLLGPALASGLETQNMAHAAAALAKAQAVEMAPPAGDMAQADPMAARTAPNPPGAAEAARSMGATVAKFMTGPNGPQVVAISVDNFDTHANQGAGAGLLATRLSYLDSLLDGLSTGLGPEWRNTVIVASTEFGRTARVNGTGGTDHGTASTALVLGGGLKRGGIIGDWPTLQPARLYEDRDTAPTLDMRALFKGVLAEHMGVERRALDGAIFPDSAMAAAASNIVA
ncbi:MAG: hypothetical protein JWO72_3018 [Caulobacteraceae bacterium]|jgi:uncharacterized protein (DUF1501 family)|nr:hypothetical protein [Caulobacteraceae bacterium]